MFKYVVFRDYGVVRAFNTLEEVEYYLNTLTSVPGLQHMLHVHRLGEKLPIVKKQVIKTTETKALGLDGISL